MGWGGSCCEVMADYTGDIAHCEDAGDEAGKQEAKEAWRKRALQYIVRTSPNNTTDDTIKAPALKKRRRVKSMHWGLALDNCLQFTTGTGLERFELTSEKRETNPYCWPSLSIVPDQGPDGNCMINAMQYGWLHKVFLILVAWDLSHGGHNDVKTAVQKCGLWGHCLLAKVASAAPHSPWGSGMRKVQVQEATREYFDHHNWDDPAFQMVLPELLYERGESHRITEHDIAKTIWMELKHSDIFERVGTKLSLSRFQALVANARSEIKKWSALQFGTMYCCQQLGLVTKTLLDKLDEVKGDAPCVNDKTTTKHDEVTQMRKLTTNNLSIACLYYSSIENKWRQGMIANVCGRVLGWHIDQNKNVVAHLQLWNTTSNLSKVGGSFTLDAFWIS